MGNDGAGVAWVGRTCLARPIPQALFIPFAITDTPFWYYFVHCCLLYTGDEVYVALLVFRVWKFFIKICSTDTLSESMAVLRRDF